MQNPLQNRLKITHSRQHGHHQHHQPARTNQPGIPQQLQPDNARERAPPDVTGRQNRQQPQWVLHQHTTRGPKPPDQRQ
ncbi:hypothetical protein Nepgr_021043 [Nepenthes gracilis]|uniref:Uncharacterized protein n=1 Tax=Nepenthes gracilis TaxID=150966 RepID=A0AAD3SZ34_NEPGR|nr:hypothetical protein Nepgr_021043 [Nepenthes gracilis]